MKTSKMKTSNKIALFLLVTGLIAGGIFFALGGYKPENWKAAAEKMRTAQGLYAENVGFNLEVAEDFGTIEIDAEHNISITSSNEITAPTVYYEDSFENQTVVTLADGKLTVTVNEFKNKIFGVSWVWISFWWDNPVITVVVPADYPLGAVQAETDHGDIAIADINPSSLRAKSGSGDVAASGVKTDAFELFTGSGNVAAVQTEAGAATLHTSSGNNTVSGMTANTVKAHSGSGSVVATDVTAAEWVELDTASDRVTADNVAAGSLKVQSGSGNIVASGVRTTGAAELSTRSGRATADNVTAEKLTVHSGSGNVYATNVTAAGEVNLNTNSGRATADNVTADKLTVHSGSGNLYVTGGEAVRYDLTTRSGRVEVSLTGDIADFGFELKNLSGRVVLNGERHENYMVSGEGKPKFLRATSGSGRVMVEIDTAA